MRSFGPVVTLVSVWSEAEEALAAANASRYGSGVFGLDRECRPRDGDDVAAAVRVHLGEHPRGWHARDALGGDEGLGHGV